MFRWFLSWLPRRLRESLLHRLGYVRFVNDEFCRTHPESCSAFRPVRQVRPQGMVERCKTCGYPVLVKFSYWELPGGRVPPEVVKWVVDEVATVTALEADQTA